MFKAIRNHYYAGLAMLMTSPLFGQDLEGVVIGAGDDKTADLDIISNVIKTGQSLLLYGLGPLVGTGMVVKGFKMVGAAERGEKAPGVTMIVCGGACFILGPIISEFITAAQ